MSWTPSLLALRRSPDSVRRSLSRINARKSPGPDNTQWSCTERLCGGTHRYLHRHFQHLTKSVTLQSLSHMLQSYRHHSSQWLPSSCTYPYPHEVLWTVSHASHLHLATFEPPTPLPVTFRRNLRSLSPSHLTSVVSSSLPSPTYFSALDVNTATETLCTTLTSCLDQRSSTMLLGTHSPE